MQKIFISSFCVLFEDYDLLEQLCKSCPEVPMGAELGTSWPIPNFDELLDSQVPHFAGGPVTLHAPFVEISGAPDSPERAAMEAAFAKAFRWYHLFGAESMVMHTHERAVPADERAQLQEWSLEAIRSVAARAKAEGLHLTVENVGFPFKDSVLLDQDEFVKMFDELPDEVGALIDTGHAICTTPTACMICTGRCSRRACGIPRRRWNGSCGRSAARRRTRIWYWNMYPARTSPPSFSDGTPFVWQTA